MDGPNVNLKFYKDFLVERRTLEPDIPIQIDILSCGLHIIHGAFKTRFDETGWRVDNILREYHRESKKFFIIALIKKCFK